MTLVLLKAGCKAGAGELSPLVPNQGQSKESSSPFSSVSSKLVQIELPDTSARCCSERKKFGTYSWTGSFQGFSGFSACTKPAVAIASSLPLHNKPIPASGSHLKRGLCLTLSVVNVQFGLKTWSSHEFSLLVLFWSRSVPTLGPTLKHGLACTAIQHICKYWYNQMFSSIKSNSKPPKGLGLRLTQFDHLVAIAVFPPATRTIHVAMSSSNTWSSFSEQCTLFCGIEMGPKPRK